MLVLNANVPVWRMLSPANSNLHAEPMTWPASNSIGESWDLRHREANTVVEQAELLHTNGVYKATRARRFTGLPELESLTSRSPRVEARAPPEWPSAVDRNVGKSCEKSGTALRDRGARGSERSHRGAEGARKLAARANRASRIVTSVDQHASMPERVVIGVCAISRAPPIASSATAIE